MKAIWTWFDGNKTTIGAILMLIVNSDYIEGLITNPDLYILARGVAGIIFGIGLTHKIKKAANKDA
ncbi:MAG: hypothetical protein ACUZ8E_12485 [Candidatus Anammoxibacter sp.]